MISSEFGLEELGVNLQPLALSPQIACQHVADAELLGDLTGLECQGLDVQRRVLGNDREVAKAGQIVDDVADDAGAQRPVRRGPGQIVQRQQGDRALVGHTARWTRGLPQEAC